MIFCRLKKSTLDVVCRFPIPIVILIILNARVLKYDWCTLGPILLLVHASIAAVAVHLFLEGNKSRYFNVATIMPPILIILWCIQLYNPQFYTFSLTFKPHLLVFEVSMICGLISLVITSPFIKAQSSNVNILNFLYKIGRHIITCGFIYLLCWILLASIFITITCLFDIKFCPDFGTFIVKFFYFCTLFIMPLIIMSGIPKDNADVSKIQGFVKYLAIPFCAIYALIIHIYAMQILISGAWPKGIICFIVIPFSVFSIATYILSVELFDKYFYKIFGCLLIVPICLLFGALYKRIYDYGITEPRYFIMVLGIWIAICILCMILHVNSIKRILICASIISIITSVGPISAYNLSTNSQKKYLAKMLTDANILHDGKIHRADDKAEINSDNFKNKSQDICRLLMYFVNTQKVEALKEWFGPKAHVNSNGCKFYWDDIALDMGLIVPGCIH